MKYLGSKLVLSGIAICALLLSLGGGVASAQSTNLQKALEDVRAKLDDLIAAKDENPASDLALRIATFQKVLTFAVTEAEDLKIKLVTLEDQNKTPEVKQWQNDALAKLNTAIARYRAEEKALQEESVITLAFIREKAEVFKTFREKDFLPLADEIQDFLLLRHEDRILQVAERRFEKITDDVRKLEEIKFKGTADLKKLFGEARTALNEGRETYEKAWSLFEVLHLVPYASTTATSTTATTTETKSTTSTQPSLQTEPPALPTTTLRSSTSTEATGASSTLPRLAGPESSIKDLAKNALDSVQETYRIFIEMSNLVRKLLK